MTKGIVFTKEMLGARENGATMFIVPISEENQVWLNDIGLDYIDEIAPLQKGDEFFIQEEFAELLEDIDDIGSEKIYYRFDGEINDCMDSDYEAIDTPWKDASQMQENQSRHKDICLDIQVKRVQDISHNNGEIYAIYPDAHEDGYDNFMHGFNDKFLDGKYEENPYIFLITYKGVNHE